MSFTICGRVVGGNKLGRELGFPTANIVVDEALGVQNGVYAARVTIGEKGYEAMANIGHKPSVSSDGARVLEVNIFDFEGDLYTQEIVVTLLDFVRSERRFSSFATLKAQISQDRETIVEIFRKS